MLSSKAKLPIAIALATAALAGCGGGGSSSGGGGGSNGGTPPVSTGTSVKGVAVKGPLVNASVKAYAVDYAASDLIGAAAPVDTGATNGQAQITGLSLDPAGAPYIVVVEADADTVDLTTGAAPVITIMKTVITADMLNGGTPVVATPLTSLATEVAASKGASPETLQQTLNDAQNTVKSTLGFGLDESVDIFTATPVLNDDTDTPEEQAQVAAYRLAVEAVSAVLSNAAADSAAEGDSATDVLSSLAQDLSDGAIDGKSGETDLPALIGVDVSSVAVADLVIPGTSIPVNTITAVLDSEAQSLGTTVTVDPSVTVEPEEVATVADSDFDGVADDVDNCLNTKNGINEDNQLDANDNGIGAACEEAPQIAGVAGSGPEDSVINIMLSGSDPDGDTLTFTVDGQTLPPGQSSYAFTPEQNFSGQVELPYSVSDGEKSSDSLITITVTPEDDAPVGTVTIVGAAEEGVELGLDNQLSDVDGPLTVVGYQWYSDELPITGATAATFTPQQQHVGLPINAVVTVSDGEFGNVEVSSNFTANIANTINNATGGSASIEGQTTEGETLSVSNSLVDPDGPVTLTSYQWLADELPIAGATTASLLLTQEQVGKAISVQLTFTDGTFVDQPYTTQPTTPVVNVNSAAGGDVSIVGTAAEDAVLEVQINAADEDGLENAVYSFQWFADGVAIDGATTSQFTPGDAEVGKAITVQVDFTDDQGGEESLASTATQQIANVNDPLQGAVVIAGTVMDTETLSVENFLAGLSDDDGLPASVPPSTSYQWKRGGVDIAGANAATYTLVTADVGLAITVEIQFPDSRGTTETVLSAPTAPVAQFNSKPVGSVTISGDTQNQLWSASNDLTDADGPDPLAISYQWFADGGAIEGETAATFTPGQSHVGASITVVASYTDNDSNFHEVPSSAVVVIDANDAYTGGVSIIGAPSEDEVLTASNDLSDPDGAIEIESYQWLANGMPIPDATSGELLLTQAEVGQNISVEVAFNDGVFGSQIETSAATSAVNNVNDVPAGSLTISGVPAPGNTLTANDAITDEDGMGMVTYQWFVDGVSTTAGATYAVQQADVGLDVFVRASYIDGQQTPEVVESASVTVEGAPQTLAYDPASFNDQTVYAVFTDDGDDSECFGTQTFARFNFEAGGNFTASMACDDSAFSGAWSFEQNNEVLVLDSAAFGYNQYVVAYAQAVDNKQNYCWVDDVDVTDSATALDICRNGESSAFYSLIENNFDILGLDTFYFSQADVHADTFDTKRFSHTWLAGRTLYDVWYGSVDTTGDCESDTDHDRGMTELVVSPDGLTVDISGVQGDSCVETGVALSINGDGQLGDTGTGAGINYLGNTDQYLEVVFRNDDGTPDNVDRFYHTESEALAAWNALPGANNPTATYTQYFQEAQLLKAPVYNVRYSNDQWLVEKLEFSEGGSLIRYERSAEEERFGRDNGLYSPEYLTYFVTDTQLSLMGGANADISWHVSEDPNIGAGYMTTSGNGYEVCWGLCDSPEAFFFSEEAAQRYIDSQNTPAAGSPLLGSWLIDEGINQRNILTFIDGSRYVVFHEHDNSDQTAGSAEFGTYTWDHETGDFTASATDQSDGEGGLGGAAFNLQVNGDAFTTNDGFGADRIVDAAQPIVGSWILGEGDDLNILTFLSDTEYAIVHTQNQDCYGEVCTPEALSGEFGVYSWDGFTFTVLSASVDSNGPGGLYNNDDPTDQQNESLELDGTTLTFTDFDEGPFVLERVGGIADSNPLMLISTEVTAYTQGALVSNGGSTMQCDMGEPKTIGETESFNEHWFYNSGFITAYEPGTPEDNWSLAYNIGTQVVTVDDAWSEQVDETFSYDFTSQGSLAWDELEQAFIGSVTDTEILQWTLDSQTSTCVTTVDVRVEFVSGSLSDFE